MATFPTHSLFSVSDAVFAAFVSKGIIFWVLDVAEVEYESGVFALAAYASANGVQRK